MAGTIGHGSTEIEEFNLFIESMELFDIPLLGRKFTWFRPNGLSMSRLDRFLISHDWAVNWQLCTQSVLLRDVSDHCPLLLRNVCQKWGPKPFRVLNCWFQCHSFKSFVEKHWSEFRVEGWGAFVLKEKLKLLKTALRSWNSEVFGDMNVLRKKLVLRINELDEKAESEGINEDERSERHKAMMEFWKVSKLNESILYQKSRVRWIKEGDMNTKYFHTLINWKRKSDSIVGLLMDGSWVEDVDCIKRKVKNFFEEKFRKQHDGRRPLLDGVTFSMLSADDNRALCEHFELDEIREAVWDCESKKSPGPNGYNFKFIKAFWEIMKTDI